MNDVLEKAPESVGDLIDRYAVYLQHWQSSCLDGAIPVKSDLPLGPIAEHVKDITIFEVMADGDILYRYFGTDVENRTGANVTGVPALPFFMPDIRNDVRTAFLDAVQTPCAYWSEFDRNNVDGGTATIVCLNLPLADAAGHGKFVLSYAQPIRHVMTETKHDGFMMGINGISLIRCSVDARVETT